MSDKQIDDAASKLKRLIRESEKRIAAHKQNKQAKAVETKSLQTLEVEYCYVDDERQRRQKFNENRSRRRSA
tara:strand:- start:273 stop:488 length:216 start_codon:yes stop_codon:yes gene_type:complete